MVRVGFVLARTTGTIELLQAIMTYIDHYQYDTSYLTDDFNRLRDAATADKPQLFVAYCRKALAAKETGTMPLRDAAYAIAGVMFMKELDDPIFDDITAQAGELELPAEHVSGNPEEKWLELVALVDRCEKMHQSAAWMKKTEADQAKMERRNKEAFEEYGEK